MKKFLLLCVATLFSVASWAFDFSSELTGTIIFYNILYDSDSPTVEVTYYSTVGYSYTDTSVVIPETVSNESETYTVVGIGEGAFKGCARLSQVEIPSTITYIGERAFMQSALTELTLPENLTSIGERAFEDCSSLERISLPENLTEIGQSAFYNCTSLKEITIPDKVTSLGAYAFYYCSAMEEAVVGNGITILNEQTFDHCSMLKEVTLNENITSIREGAFEYCSALENITLPENLTEIGQSAFYNCTSLKEITIHDNITSLGMYAFEYCEALAKVVIGKGITIVPQEAFCFCYALEDLTFGENVSTIGKWSFYQCDEALEKVVVPESVTSIDYGAFEYCYKLKTLTIENAHTYIDQEAFCFCRELADVTLGENVSTIGQWAFYECLALTDLYVPESVISIDYGAFEYCISLKKLTIGNGCTTIGEEAFCCCYDLMTVSLGENVSSIESSAFEANAKLVSFTLLNTTPPSCGTTVFSTDVPSTCILYVPASAVSDYFIAPTWEEFSIQAILPTVATFEATDVTDSSSTLNGFVAAINSEDILECGFEYWRDDNEVQIVKVDTTTDGDISASLSDLHYGTQYTYRTYASTANNTSYGEELTFTTTINAPMVETLDATSVKATYAVLNATIELGSEELMRKGFLCWSDGSNEITTILVDEEEGEQMSAILSGLTPETTYTYCAFATTELLGTTYGENLTFSTLDIVSGIANVETDGVKGETVEGIYSTSGQKLNTTVKGVNIIRYNDGKTKKVLIK